MVVVVGKRIDMCKKVVDVVVVMYKRGKIEFVGDGRNVEIIVNEKKIGIFERIFPSA